MPSRPPVQEADSSDVFTPADPSARLLPDEALGSWEALKRQTAVLLREPAPSSAWVSTLIDTASRVQSLARHDPDTALYLLLQAAGHEVDQYSVQHAMLCAIICTMCAQWLEWPEAETEAVGLAALTMNLSMTSLQDALARQVGGLSAVQRERIDAHPQESATLLAEAGVSDALWLDTVKLHHSVDRHADARDEPAPAERLAHLLHRVDIYTAKLSRRVSRHPASPALAARDACLDGSGLPDAIGATILRILGLYPPGSYVALANGEIGVVVRRGAKAHTPVVASLRRSDGGLFLQPAMRDTALRAHAVLCGVPVPDVKVHMNHQRVLGAT